MLGLLCDVGHIILSKFTIYHIKGVLITISRVFSYSWFTKYTDVNTSVKRTWYIRCFQPFMGWASIRAYRVFFSGLNLKCI